MVSGYPGKRVPESARWSGSISVAVEFAINFAVHSYLIVAWSDRDRVSMNVGFYYMARSAGRLTGTVLSGLVYQHQGLVCCLWWSTAFLLDTGLLSMRLPRDKAVIPGRGSAA